MFIKVLKIIISVLVVVVFFSLITKRDLRFKAQETARELLPQLSQTTPPRAIATTQEKYVLSKKQEVPKPEEIPLKKQSGSLSIYIPLSEGVSDTDESYRPKLSPCITTITYKIGTFDTRFGISQEHFVQEINAAGDLWGDVFGKKLFTYDEHGELTINLIYDERQASTDEVNNLALEIENSKTAAENVHQVYEQEKIIYLTEGNQFTQDTENFQLRYKAYGEKVANYNASGGAQKVEYDAMMNELVGLKQESALLEERRGGLTSFMNSINDKARRYNEFVSYVNTLIKKSNSLGAKKFTEGRFSPQNNTIDIYQYNDTNKLRRVIAHELGHALGINHNNNTSSIMYLTNSATTTKLSPEDLKALHTLCMN